MRKVLPFRIPKPEESALIYQVDKAVQFYDQLHQHKEIQISIVLAGEGDLIVGDRIHHFTANDIFIIGSNLPHLFRNIAVGNTEAHMLTLFFTRESFGEEFFAIPEMQQLETSFKNFERGLRIDSQKGEIKRLFLELESQSGLERFISFLQILKYVQSARCSFLSSFNLQKMYTENDGERMSKVMHFTLSHYNETITLPQIAALANMTPNAFCRYFKRRTRKTYFQFLLEVRIEAACRILLNDTNRSVIAISESTGFTNLSHFNRKFKAIKGMTPTEFRNTSFKY